jgi:hypothetical protein
MRQLKKFDHDGNPNLKTLIEKTYVSMQSCLDYLYGFKVCH